MAKSYGRTYFVSGETQATFLGIGHRPQREHLKREKDQVFGELPADLGQSHTHTTSKGPPYGVDEDEEHAGEAVETRREHHLALQQNRFLLLCLAWN